MQISDEVKSVELTGSISCEILEVEQRTIMLLRVILPFYMIYTKNHVWKTESESLSAVSLVHALQIVHLVHDMMHYSPLVFI